MFGTKEIESLGYYTGDMLEQVAGSMAYLAGGDSDYANHVDSERSVTGGAEKTLEDIQQAADDAVQQEPSLANSIISGERLEVLLELRETVQKSMQMEVILFLMRQKHRIVERGFHFRMDFSCIFPVIGVRMN